jgi:hypothetical protein
MAIKPIPNRQGPKGNVVNQGGSQIRQFPWSFCPFRLEDVVCDKKIWGIQINQHYTDKVEVVMERKDLKRGSILLFYQEQHLQ